MTHVEWHPYPEEKPKQLTSYLVTVRLPTVGSYRTVLFYAVRSPDLDMWGLDRSGSQGRVVAWAEIPDAYEPKEGEAEWLQPKLI